MFKYPHLKLIENQETSEWYQLYQHIAKDYYLTLQLPIFDIKNLSSLQAVKNSVSFYFYNL